MKRGAWVLAGLTMLASTPEVYAQTGQTFVVNTTANGSDAAIGDGVCATVENVCSLRAGIEEANATPALDTIAFAIASGTQRILVPTRLPAITRPVVIDATTQPEYAGSPIIELRGSLVADDGLHITGGGSTVRAVVINGFGGNGVRISGLGGNVLEGNYIGIDVAGTAAVRNIAAGVRVESPGNRIGGTQIAQRNVISGNGGLGIEGGILIYGPQASGNVVQGNFIGLDAAGINPIGNLGRGVAIHAASNNLVGGTTAAAGNLIAGNRASGVRIMPFSTNNIVMRNWIGINKLGEMRRGEFPAPGILSNARGVHIRGDNNFAVENIIAGNTWDGVLFSDGLGADLIPLGYPSNNVVYKNLIVGNGINGIGVYVGTRNAFVANQIFGNSLLGINLANHALEGVTENDAGDADAGTNDLLNFPVLASAVVAGSQTTVVGTLDSTPDTDFLVELYAVEACAMSGHGEGRYLLAQLTLTTDASGSGSFQSVVPAAIPPGWVVTATATNGGGSTSEFSRCVTVR